MMQPKRYAYCAALVSAVMIPAGCSGASHFVPSSAVPSTQMHVQTVTQAPVLDDIALSVPNVAGTWSGTFIITVSGHSESGTEKLVITQAGSTIGGHVVETLKGTNHTFKMSGTVTRTKTGAHLKFTIFNQNGRNGNATASVVGESMHGKVLVPASGGQPGITISFKAKTP